MRRSDIAKKLVIGSLALSAAPAIVAKQPGVKVVFCVAGAQGRWDLRQFKPLIDPRAETVFAEMSFAGPLLLEFRLRRFYEQSEVAFDYKFDAGGRLNALEGSVTVFGAWVGEANLFPDADGTVPPYHVLYSRNNQRVPKPDDAADYIARLDEAPIYRTIQHLPCAAMMKEAVRINATQE